MVDNLVNSSKLSKFMGITNLKNNRYIYISKKYALFCGKFRSRK